VPRTAGQQILLYGTDPFTFPANTPFYIQHGYHQLDPNEAPYKQLDFRLFIDGVQQVNGRKRRCRTVTATGIDYWFLWTFIFPHGLPVGSYVFRREYWVACHIAEAWGTVPKCADPNEIVLGFSNDKKGNFIASFIKIPKVAKYKIQID
jgi:hypothetical protein